MNIDKANATDLPAVLDLLRASKLPVEGLAAHADSLLVAHGEGRVMGCAGLELYGGAALLRSVAVAAGARGTGLGRQLTAAALDLARTRGVREVYLLTETAAGFFPKFGFTETTRDQVPEEVKTSVEFASACPQSATVMKRLL